MFSLCFPPPLSLVSGFLPVNRTCSRSVHSTLISLTPGLGDSSAWQRMKPFHECDKIYQECANTYLAIGMKQCFASRNEKLLNVWSAVYIYTVHTVQHSIVDTAFFWLWMKLMTVCVSIYTQSSSLVSIHGRRSHLIQCILFISM